MASAWDTALEEAEKASGGGGDFVRVGPGESVTGVFNTLTPPFKRWVVWDSLAGCTVDYVDGKDYGDGRPRRRYLLHFMDEATKSVRIFDLAAPTFKDVGAAVKKHGKDTDGLVVLEISRTGSGKSTEWRVMFDRYIKPEAVAPLRAAFSAAQPIHEALGMPPNAPEPKRAPRPAKSELPQPGDFNDEDIPF